MSQLALVTSLKQIISDMKSISKNSWSLKDFRFLFKPRSIFFLKKNNHNYKIYLEKGMQVIGTVQELIPAMAPQIKYSLSQFNRPIQFRIAADAVPNYFIVLYQVSETGIEQVAEQYQLKISKFIEEYYKEFLSFDQQMSGEIKGKDITLIADTWKGLSNGFTKKHFTSSARFEKIEAILEFVVEPIHHYDDLVKEAEIEEQKRREKRQKKQEVNYFKSKSIPEVPENKKTLKRGYSDNEPLLKPFSFHGNSTQAEKNHIKQELKNFVIQIPNVKTMEEQATSIKIEEPSFVSSKKAAYSQKVYVIPENQKQDQREHSVPSVQSLEKEKNQNKPVAKRQEKYSLMPEIKSEVKIVSDKGNEVAKGSTLVSNISIGVFVLASLVFVFILMHPLPKA